MLIVKRREKNQSIQAQLLDWKMGMEVNWKQKSPHKRIFFNRSEYNQKQIQSETLTVSGNQKKFFNKSFPMKTSSSVI